MGPCGLGRTLLLFMTSRLAKFLPESSVVLWASDRVGRRLCSQLVLQFITCSLWCAPPGVSDRSAGRQADEPALAGRPCNNWRTTNSCPSTRSSLVCWPPCPALCSVRHFHQRHQSNPHRMTVLKLTPRSMTKGCHASGTVGLTAPYS